MPVLVGVLSAMAPLSAAAGAETLKLLVLGDSLAAGYGLPQKDAFPVRLQAALKAKGNNVRVINGGVSGDTSAGGLSRIGWALADKPQLVIVELGANDALRGLNPKSTYTNLDRLLGRLKAAGTGVLLAGMYAPPNWGSEYVREFNAIYPRLAKRHSVMFYPFFLDGVAAVPGLNQRDGIHPNAKGVAEIVNRITPIVLRLIRIHAADRIRD